MLEEFKRIYTAYSWLRWITWSGLLCTALFLLLAFSGPVPQLLLDFIHTLFQLPNTWRLQGIASLQPLLARLSGLLAWAIGGYLLARATLLVAHYQRGIVLLEQQRPGVEWVSSQQVSLALSLPMSSLAASLSGDNAAIAGDTFTIEMPRLRLPQKPLQPLRQEEQVHPISQTLRTPAQLAVQDLPTRPDYSLMTTGGLMPATSTEPLSSALSTQPLLIGVGWHAGIVRRQNPNEDSLVFLQGTCTYHGQLVPFGLFVVADGMGGHDCGQEASRLAIQSMMHTVLQNIVMSNELTDDFLIDMMIGGVDWANLAIFQRAQAWGKRMGTTLTAALVVGMKAYVVNVGDSRTYHYREGATLTQITRDHSLVATLVARGQITPDEIYTHPERSKVYRCLGSDNSVMVDWFMADLYSHDRLLLCSDGLWEMVRDPEIERILRGSNDPTRASNALLQTALRNGGVDNVSLIVVRVP